MQINEITITEIKRKFDSEVLPGMKAMQHMAPPHRQELIKSHTQIPQKASVLLLVYPKNNKLYFPLIIRSSENTNDRHRGQIALPGGKYEKADKNDWQCAIRETNEELGIPKKSISYLGTMTPNFIPVSNYIVYPFVGSLSSRPVFRRQEEEVAEILEIPLEELLNPGNIKCGEFVLSSGLRLQNIPYFDLCGHKVWGATAMMLNEFVTLFASNPLP